LTFYRTKYIPPKFNAKNFSCPFCKVLSQQEWTQPNIGYDLGRDYINTIINNKLLHYSTCRNCSRKILWLEEILDLKNEIGTGIGKIIYPPDVIGLPPPNDDLDTEIQDLYKEAASIVIYSPRGACALLRVCLEKFLEQLDKILDYKLDGDINNKIAILVTNGLSPTIQKAMDSVRFFGNESVHSGVLTFDGKDTEDNARKMFGLLNDITYELITRPQEIADIYEEKIPETKKEAIEKRKPKKK